MRDTAVTSSLRNCAIRVPCSTSNLGAGFDTLGLAFDRYLDAGFMPGDSELTAERAGTLREIVSDADDRLLLAFRAELQRRGAGHVGGTIYCTSSIPIGRGLGSSGAAAVAGIALATAACADTLDREAALASAVRIEEHPDNAAPSVYGGLVAVAYAEHGVPRAMRLPLSPDIAFVFAAPEARVATERARAALPQHVPHSAAVRNIGRMAALLHGLANADPVSISLGFGDELHVPYRLPLIPRAAAVMKAATDAGAWAVTISGSGSGLLAACAPGHALRVADAMQTAFADAQADAFVARADMHGAQPRDFGGLRDALRIR